MTVLQLVPRTKEPEMVEVLRNAIRMALRGELEGVSLLCRHRGGLETLTLTGCLKNNPEEMLRVNRRVRAMLRKIAESESDDYSTLSGW